MALILATFMIAILTIYLSCRPFNHYWQINPDPGNVCQAGNSKSILWVSFVSNVSTDILLFLIPIPMLWQSSLRLVKKLAATLVLSGGVLIMVCATLKSVYVIVVSFTPIATHTNVTTSIAPQALMSSSQKRAITDWFQDPINGGALAAQWGTRETFIAVVTTNLPMIFPLLKTWLGPLSPSFFRSSSNKAYKSPGSGAFVTIGGSGAPSNRMGSQNASRITGTMTMDNESEEHIVKDGGDVEMHYLHSGSMRRAPNTIVVSKQVSVTSEERDDKESRGSSRGA